MQETWGRSLGWEDPLEKGMATHSSKLAWRIPWTEEPCGLQSMGLQRIGHNWANKYTTIKTQRQGLVLSSQPQRLLVIRLIYILLNYTSILFQINFKNTYDQEKLYIKWKSLSHVRLCDSMDCSPQGSSVREILQARILEWVAIFFSTKNVGWICEWNYIWATDSSKHWTHCNQ